MSKGRIKFVLIELIFCAWICIVASEKPSLYTGETFEFEDLRKTNKPLESKINPSQLDDPDTNSQQLLADQKASGRFFFLPLIIGAIAGAVAGGAAKKRGFDGEASEKLRSELDDAQRAELEQLTAEWRELDHNIKTQREKFDSSLLLKFYEKLRDFRTKVTNKLFGRGFNTTWSSRKYIGERRIPTGDVEAEIRKLRPVLDNPVDINQHQLSGRNFITDAIGSLFGKKGDKDKAKPEEVEQKITKMKLNAAQRAELQQLMDSWKEAQRENSDPSLLQKFYKKLKEFKLKMENKLLGRGFKTIWSARSYNGEPAETNSQQLNTGKKLQGRFFITAIIAAIAGAVGGGIAASKRSYNVEQTPEVEAEITKLRRNLTDAQRADLQHVLVEWDELEQRKTELNDPTITPRQLLKDEKISGRFFFLPIIAGIAGWIGGSIAAKRSHNGEQIAPEVEAELRQWSSALNDPEDNSQQLLKDKKLAGRFFFLAPLIAAVVGGVSGWVAGSKKRSYDPEGLSAGRVFGHRSPEIAPDFDSYNDQWRSLGRGFKTIWSARSYNGEPTETNSQQVNTGKKLQGRFFITAIIAAIAGAVGGGIAASKRSYNVEQTPEVEAEITKLRRNLTDAQRADLQHVLVEWDELEQRKTELNDPTITPRQLLKDEKIAGRFFFLPIIAGIAGWIGGSIAAKRSHNGEQIAPEVEAELRQWSSALNDPEDNSQQLLKDKKLAGRFFFLAPLIAAVVGGVSGWVAGSKKRSYDPEGLSAGRVFGHRSPEIAPDFDSYNDQWRSLGRGFKTIWSARSYNGEPTETNSQQVNTGKKLQGRFFITAIIAAIAGAVGGGIAASKRSYNVEQTPEVEAEITKLRRNLTDAQYADLQHVLVEWNELKQREDQLNDPTITPRQLLKDEKISGRFFFLPIIAGIAGWIGGSIAAKRSHNGEQIAPEVEAELRQWSSALNDPEDNSQQLLKDKKLAGRFFFLAPLIAAVVGGVSGWVAGSKKRSYDPEGLSAGRVFGHRSPGIAPNFDSYNNQWRSLGRGFEGNEVRTLTQYGTEGRKVLPSDKKISGRLGFWASYAAGKLVDSVIGMFSRAYTGKQTPDDFEAEIREKRPELNDDEIGRLKKLFIDLKSSRGDKGLTGNEAEIEQGQTQQLSSDKKLSGRFFFLAPLIIGAITGIAASKLAKRSHDGNQIPPEDDDDMENWRSGLNYPKSNSQQLLKNKKIAGRFFHGTQTLAQFEEEIRKKRPDLDNAEIARLEKLWIDLKSARGEEIRKKRPDLDNAEIARLEKLWIDLKSARGEEIRKKRPDLDNAEIARLEKLWIDLKSARGEEIRKKRPDLDNAEIARLEKLWIDLKSARGEEIRKKRSDLDNAEITRLRKLWIDLKLARGEKWN